MSESKSNVNESILPLLDDDANKEKIELKTKEEGTTATGEASTTNTTDEAKAAKEKEAEEAKRKKEEEKERKRKLKEEEEEKKKQAKLEKQKKKDEEKEQKRLKKAEKKAAAEAAKANGGAGGNEQLGRSRVHPLCSVATFTTAVNLLDRDERSINDHVNLNFEDILGEPDATQGFEGAYRLSYGLFQFVRFWVYRLLMAIIAVPLALVWAVVFALISVLSVWVLTPAFRLLDLVFYFLHRFWNATVRTVLDPVFISLSLVRQSNNPFHRTPVATCSGRPIVVPSQYSVVPTNGDDSDDAVTDKQITLNIENV